MSRKEVRTAAKRANGHPLNIIYNNGRSTPLRRMKIFLEESYRNSRRWRSTNMRVTFPEELAGLTTLPAPLLDDCDLYVLNEDEELVDIFGGQTPLLKHLALLDIVVP